MKTRISALVIGLVVVAMPAMAAPAQVSQIFPDLNVTYAESIDAGQSINGGSYQVAAPGSPGSSLTQITGSIVNTSDADIFQINILDPSAFSATTINALTTGNGLDTVLWLFNSSGGAVIANDDANGTTLQSTLSSFLGTGGTFYLAISLSGNEPVNFANQLMFASNGDPTAVRGPAGGVPGAQNDFDPSGVGFGAFTGNYQIDLVGASVVPEPSVAATFILGSLVSGALFFARRRRAGRALLLLAAFGIFVTSSLFATDIPKNLGYGLDKLVESNLILKAQGNEKKKASLVGQFNGYATEEAANYAAMAIMGKDGRVKVDITLNGKVSFKEMQAALKAKFPSFEITATDATYRNGGILEGWLSVDEAAALSQMEGVRSVFLGLKPHTNGGIKTDPSDKGGYNPQAGPSVNFAMLGTKFLQGVTQHRVDKINQFYNASAPVNYDGTGITVGVLSDSFASSAAAANTNVNNFDLPGAAGNPVNTQPVVVLQDAPGNSDEGRGMCEIVYKMAPKAKLGFATAFTGEVEFANNIRALSGQFPAVPHTQVGFAATVICDDVSYGGEPVFADGGVVGNGIDDVAAVGVSYFSSAANSYGVSVYNSDLRMVPYTGGTTSADCTALVGTNINLAGVPTGLYQGGFHNFNPTPGQQDVACLWNIGTGGSGIATEMQWDDPYDTSDPDINDPPIYSNTGFINSATPVNFTDIPSFTAGQEYVVSETATSGNFDGIVSIIDSNANIIVDQDTGTDEVVTFFSPTTEQYSIRVRRFSTTTGNFDLVINTANGTPLLSTDLNLLVFRADTGAYISSSSLTSNNYANNRPVELGTVARPSGQTQVQFVIARSSNPVGPRAATRVHCGTDANSNANNAPAEYFDYNSAVTAGHSIAAGCNGSAAYDVFRPNVPQNFTSGGPAHIFFDRDQNLKPNAPEIRLQPRIAAANGSNSTWTSGDSSSDIDTGGGQFYGTSAAAPHAAGVAALVLQAHGGPTSVTPAQMTSILQSTAFPHDLDPYTAIGSARATDGGKITVTIRSDNTAPSGATQNRGRLDANSHTIAYTGASAISTFKFNPNGLISQGGAVTSGQNGVDISNNYFSNVTPGMYFAIATATGAEPFALGSGTVGLTLADVVPVLSNPAPAPANINQGQTLTLAFAPGSFTGGDILRFKIGRGIIRGPNVAAANGASASNYNADLFGGGVLIPEGTIIPDGMRFSGTLENGATFEGIMKNRIGNGYSQLDGYGFLNAEAAVSAPLP